MPNNVTLRGPKFEPSSVRKIMDKLENRLNSLHYDTHYIDKHVKGVYQPVQKKFTKFYDAKLKYSKIPEEYLTTNNSGQFSSKNSFLASTNMFAES